MSVKEESEKHVLIFKKRPWHPVLTLHGKKKGKKKEVVTDFYFLGFQNHCRQ